MFAPHQTQYFAWQLTRRLSPEDEGKLTGAIMDAQIDAAQLAQFYANDLLTIVQLPELVLEQDRDLLRSRQSLMHQRERVRRLSVLRFRSSWIN